MYRVTSLAIASLAVVAALGTAPAASATAPAPAGPSSAAAFRCDPGRFCIYSGWDGGGTRCQWASERVANTADLCSFIRNGRNVLSVWNGTGHRVQYYTQTNFNNRVGSTAAGHGGNLMGTYQIRSFQRQ
ncbi:peptidase inhibitor family I36 protein [Streptomyces sp. CSDS2]|uniref:peptidase inhibitor family I36 protein n=1 Tax=Streptomyces sp. CSDS2 TaxID=3055051 RepID=UPI0025AFB1EC|nr:peptidase inhibitor family I36 protein [Streptomyces sp. CSDS2]MDN3262028.1 peptidase inhibitor family I36 protein [Streptomyces sp. CSDS2]